VTLHEHQQAPLLHLSLITTAAVALAALLAAASAAGRAQTVILLAAGIGAAFVVIERPRWALLAILVATGTVLPIRFGPFEVAGVRSDLPEALLILLLVTWVVSATLKGESFPLLAWPVAGLVGAATVGAITALAKGAAFGEVLGAFKTYIFWLLLLPLWVVIREDGDSDWVERAVIWLAVGASALTLVLAAAGVGAPSGETGVTTLGVESEATRYRPAVLQIAFLSTFLLAHRAAIRGWTMQRATAFGLLLLVQAISFNRSTWVALGVCLTLFGLLSRGGPPLRGLTTVLTSGALVVAALGIAASGVLGGSAEALALRANSVLTPSVFEERSQELRNEENEVAVRAIKANPLTGVGLNQRFGQRTSRYSHQVGYAIYSDTTLVHNTYLKLWLETGLAGILALAGLAVALATITRRHRRGESQWVASRSLACSMCLLGFALQAIYQTKLYHRPTIVAAACALVIVGAGDLARRERPVAASVA